MDLVQEKAIAYQQLMNYSYYIVLGRKSKLYEFILTFSAEDFMHIIGFHKLKDLEFLKKSAVNVFKDCLSGKITFEMISKSEFYPAIQNRFEYFDKIESMLDNNNLVIICNQKKMRQYSTIPAHYIAESVCDTLIFYIFIKHISEYYSNVISFFCQEGVNYRNGNMLSKLLYKEKQNTNTGEKIIQINELKEDEQELDLEILV